jgi:acyl dehydratase
VRFGSGSVGLGGEISWPRPTRPGDTLHVETEILEIIPSRSKPNQGVVKMRTSTFNQNGEEVQVFTVKIIVFKRPA